METAEIQASLQSPLFFRLVEDGDRRCHSDLIWMSPVTLHFFFPLCVLKRCPFPIFRGPGGLPYERGGHARRLALGCNFQLLVSLIVFWAKHHYILLKELTVYRSLATGFR